MPETAAPTARPGNTPAINSFFRPAAATPGARFAGAPGRERPAKKSKVAETIDYEGRQVGGAWAGRSPLLRVYLPLLFSFGFRYIRAEQ
eukprot:1652063-Prymnesium_polylepis.1